MIALVEFDQLVAGAMRSAVSGQIQGFDDLRELRAVLGTETQFDTVVIGPSIDMHAAADLSSAFRAKRPELGFILIRQRVDTTVITEALRAGMRDVLADRDMTQLNDAVKRSRAVTRDLLEASDRGVQEERRGRIITVFSPKGGCGKTTVATSLAGYLATSGKGSVALVDLDLAFGDVCISLQIRPKHSISDAVAMGEQLDTTGVLALLEQHKSGVHVLAAPPSPELAESVPESTIFQVIDLLSAAFDYVVIDSPPAMDATTLVAFDNSDIIALLTTLDVPSLKNTKLSLETFKLLGFKEDRLRLVLNRADSKVGIAPHEVDEALDMGVSCLIPSSRDVPASINRGELLAIEEPRHPFSMAVAAFAESHLAVNGNSAFGQAAPARRSLFRRKA